MLKFLSFSSGSCGNCYYLGEEGQPGILIDAGVSYKRVHKYMAEYRIPEENISAILITHEHLDHIRSLGGVTKHLPVPVYVAQPLHKVLANHSFVPTTTACLIKEMPEGEFTRVAPGIEVRWFEVPHDSRHNSGFFIKIAGHTYTHMTDCGQMTEEAIAFCKQSDSVTIESNYDVEMLIKGKYTPELKERILKNSGHLSNDDCAKAIQTFYHEGLRNLFLCHRSQNNNTKEKCLESARNAIRQIGVDLGTINLRLLEREKPMPPINL